MNDLERLAGETLCVGVPDATLDDRVRDDLRALAPGAFVLFTRNVSTLEATRQLVRELRAAAGGTEPALVCVDQEGGRVLRLPFGATPMPSMMALGAARDLDLAERAGARLASDVRAIEADVDFAPVLDLALAEASTVIGTRAFGADPALVAALGAALVRGLSNGGIASVPKHFPGHGATGVDSHAALPTVATSLARLRERELVPFAAAFAAGASGVMSAHVVFPALDGDRPATLSQRVLTTLLRGELAFEGVCFTDCLQMRAVSDTYGTARAAVRALAAGADCCIVSDDLVLAREARDAIVAAVGAGTLPYARLADAAARVGRLRTASARARARAGARSDCGAGDDPALASEIAARAVTRVAGDVRLDLAAPVTVVSFEGDAGDGVASSAAERPSLSLALRRRRLKSERMRVPLEPDRGMCEMLSDVIATQGARNVVIVARRAHLHAAQRGAIEALVALAPHAIAISAREPFDTPALAGARGVLACYGDDEAAMEALADVLCGRTEAPGTLPAFAASAR
ncbi:MAG: glycoside hydrolase family 3 protein [Vulcanimicrobiaceae bacterium]